MVYFDANCYTRVVEVLQYGEKESRPAKNVVAIVVLVRWRAKGGL